MTASMAQERATTFHCADATLVGIVHRPMSPGRRGVVIVVGGPQYRVGSHRQFLLLARRLAEQGFPAMRFDHRGIGDSDGPHLGFEALGADIAAAIDAFTAECPEIEEVVLWGLCDAASAILFYAHRDPRVCGTVLLNPWIRTPESETRTYLRHYYLRRLVERDLWRKVISGRFRPWDAGTSLLGLINRQFHGKPAATIGGPVPSRSKPQPLPERMADGLARFKGPTLLIMSGNDLTAREFDDTARKSSAWRLQMAEARLQRRDLAAADHTFSRRAWRDIVASWTVDWLRSW
jgi:uncharacterized protein